MRLLLLSLFAAVSLSSCHLVVYDVAYRPVPHVIQPVQVVHCHHHETPRCRMHEERPGRKGRVINILGKRSVSMCPFVAAAPPKKRY